MKLKISDNPTDQAKIEDALRRVNGQATRHTYSSASEILAIAQEAEQELDRLLLPKKKTALAQSRRKHLAARCRELTSTVASRRMSSLYADRRSGS